MRNFGGRIGFPNDNIFDARDLLRAKQNKNSNNFNNNRQYSRAPIDARSILSTHNAPTKPSFNFTIPTKTIHNDIYIKKKVETPNYPMRRPIETPYLKPSLPSSRTFADPKVSQGIFSRSMERSKYPPFKPNLIENKTPVKRSSTGQIEARDIPKRTRVDDVEAIKFTVQNNEKKVERPPLTTARFSNTKAAVKKSLISPIQGYRIEVKNLHPQVTVDDVHELFTSLSGDLRSCSLVRPGYAEVVFRRLEDAQRAIEEFHGRELDEKPMSLNLVTPALQPASQTGDDDVRARIARIQASRKSAPIAIDNDAIFRSMYMRPAVVVDPLRASRKP